MGSPGRDRLDRIFKAYDVRGRVDTGELDAEVAERIGVGFARVTGASTVALGRDCRPSSESLAAAFREGVLSQGCDVTDLGELPTEVVYYHSGRYRIPGAVVTASHNPAGYNGLKFCHRGAAPIGSGTGLERIREEARAWSGAAGAAARGGVTRHDALPGYLEHVFGIVDPAGIGELRVAVDGGNGMAGPVVNRLFRHLPSSTSMGLYLEPDGTFPNHPADPLNPDNLTDLVHLVREQEADVGVAFDGDADRAVFVDEQGVPLPGSTTTAIIARWFLALRPGARIVHNLICSRSVAEAVRSAGGVPVRTRVGHSFIKAVMAEKDAVFGGEHSGHYYFGDNYGADSATLAMLVLLTVLTGAGVPLSELRRGYEPYAMSGEINFVVTDPTAALRAVESAFSGASLDRLDGLTVDLGDSWFNVRPSNTEQLLRLNAEAPDSGSMDELVDRVRGVIDSS
ncbi:phosphomannomutase/phosphoglucomutase [Candidatus Spongiisocius sp.]|uniref:phosphomannomutase/phosphoglucomutase n=1 Tax=Candidatus Spongiisocius sp. TaxID=3101273 RepID=UPI003B5A37E7